MHLSVYVGDRLFVESSETAGTPKQVDGGHWAGAAYCRFHLFTRECHAASERSSCFPCAMVCMLQSSYLHLGWPRRLWEVQLGLSQHNAEL